MHDQSNHEITNFCASRHLWGQQSSSSCRRSLIWRLTRMQLLSTLRFRRLGGSRQFGQACPMLLPLMWVILSPITGEVARKRPKSCDTCWRERRDVTQRSDLTMWWPLMIHQVDIFSFLVVGCFLRCKLRIAKASHKCDCHIWMGWLHSDKCYKKSMWFFSYPHLNQRFRL